MNKIFRILICAAAIFFIVSLAYAKKYTEVARCETDEDTLVEICYDKDGDLMRGMGIEGKMPPKKIKKSKKATVIDFEPYTVSKFRRGKREGLSEEMDESGFGLKRTYYSKGIKNGTYEEYHKGHTRYIQAFYSDGLINGRVTYYNEEGKKIGVADYKYGKLIKGYCRNEKKKKVKFTKEFIKSQLENELVECPKKEKED